MGNDLGEALKKAGLKTGGGGVQKKCRDCGRPLKHDRRYDTCYECGKKRKQKHHGGRGLPDDYLSGGYFDSNGYLKESIFKDDAKTVARTLASLRMTSTSFRAFYNKVKAIENVFKATKDFDAVKPKLFAFERDVAYQESRGVVEKEFSHFIIKNAKLAQKGPKEFKGFVEHFFSVLAYFKDYSKR